MMLTSAVSTIDVETLEAAADDTVFDGAALCG